MRNHGIILFTAVIAAFMLAPSSLFANPILNSAPAAEETLESIPVSLSDVVNDSSAASAEATSVHSEESDFLSPEFLSYEPGTFPTRLYRAQDMLNEVPEPFSAPWLTCGLLTIGWLGARKRP
ncbi:MAG TPA: hypothetical protein VKT81_17485 [Bryobacteraceae bacterium]|nr:hypothetical protein [Bryobacteraceae bacterium]